MRKILILLLGFYLGNSFNGDCGPSRVFDFEGMAKLAIKNHFKLSNKHVNITDAETSSRIKGWFINSPLLQWAFDEEQTQKIYKRVELKIGRYKIRCSVDYEFPSEEKANLYIFDCIHFGDAPTVGTISASIPIVRLRYLRRLGLGGVNQSLTTLYTVEGSSILQRLKEVCVELEHL